MAQQLAQRLLETPPDGIARFVHLVNTHVIPWMKVDPIYGSSVSNTDVSARLAAVEFVNQKGLVQAAALMRRCLSNSQVYDVQAIVQEETGHIVLVSISIENQQIKIHVTVRRYGFNAAASFIWIVVIFLFIGIGFSVSNLVDETNTSRRLYTRAADITFASLYSAAVCVIGSTLLLFSDLIANVENKFVNLCILKSVSSRKPSFRLVSWYKYVHFSDNNENPDEHMQMLLKSQMFHAPLDKESNINSDNDSEESHIEDGDDYHLFLEILKSASNLPLPARIMHESIFAFETIRININPRMDERRELLSYFVWVCHITKRKLFKAFKRLLFIISRDLSPVLSYEDVCVMLYLGHHPISKIVFELYAVDGKVDAREFILVVSSKVSGLSLHEKLFLAFWPLFQSHTYITKTELSKILKATHLFSDEKEITRKCEMIMDSVGGGDTGVPIEMILNLCYNFPACIFPPY